MNDVYGRDLDLNLLRVFLAVADSGSVTRAASQLYLTQPAVSAALRRLTRSTGATLFTRRGRGLALTHRGERLLAALRPHLLALVAATLSPPRFDPKTSDRTLRLGLADSMESWLLPRLLRTFASSAPAMRLAIVSVQFRTVGEALALRQIDVAVTVADALPASVRRHALFHGRFVCLFDPRHPAHANVKARMTERQYFERPHVVVSYNGDLRGIVEDMLRKQRDVRCSVPSFASIGAIVEGSPLVATIPDIVAEQIRKTRPRLVAVPVPFDLAGSAIEMLWPEATEEDDACRFLRDSIVAATASRA